MFGFKRKKYKEIVYPALKDKVWVLESSDINECFDIIKNFIEENKKENYTLSVYDSIEGKTMEIKCKVSDILQIVQTISNAEHSLINSIGTNSVTECYVVGMDFTRGVCKPGMYEYENGKIIKIRDWDIND